MIEDPSSRIRPPQDENVEDTNQQEEGEEEQRNSRIGNVVDMGHDDDTIKGGGKVVVNDPNLLSSRLGTTHDTALSTTTYCTHSKSLLVGTTTAAVRPPSSSSMTTTTTTKEGEEEQQEDRIGSARLWKGTNDSVTTTSTKATTNVGVVSIKDLDGGRMKFHDDGNDVDNGKAGRNPRKKRPTIVEHTLEFTQAATTRTTSNTNNDEEDVLFENADSRRVVEGNNPMVHPPPEREVGTNNLDHYINDDTESMIPQVDEIHATVVNEEDDDDEEDNPTEDTTLPTVRGEIMMDTTITEENTHNVKTISTTVCGFVWQKRIVYYVLMGNAILLLFFLILYFPLSASSPPNNSSTTKLDMNDFLVRTLPKDTVETIQHEPSSPQTKAYRWMILREQKDNENGIAFDYSNNNDNLEDQIIQRFALMTLYYSIGGDVVLSDDDDNLCNYYGVLCQQEHLVFHLELDAIGLRGEIPPEIGLLTQLRHLSLQSNSLRGTLPTEMGQLTQLQTLQLSKNQFIGTIPNELQFSHQLTYISLYQNQFHGTIPQFGNNTNIHHLDLHDNQLVGTIPTAMGVLTSVSYFDISHNRINGTIPTEMGQFTNLQRLYLNSNQLSGSIPSQIGQLSSLVILSIFDNKELTGRIPQEICNLSQLGEFGTLSFLYGSCTTGINDLICQCCTHCCIDNVTSCTPLQ